MMSRAPVLSLVSEGKNPPDGDAAPLAMTPDARVVLRRLAGFPAGIGVGSLAHALAWDSQRTWVALRVLIDFRAVEERTTNIWRLSCVGALGIVADRVPETDPRPQAWAWVVVGWAFVGMLGLFCAALLAIDASHSRKAVDVGPSKYVPIMRR